MQLVDNINIANDIFQFNPLINNKIIDYINHLEEGIE